MPRLKFTQLEAERYLALLAETASRIQVCTKDVDEALLSSSMRRGEWSVADILAHLRACAEVWSNSIYAMLAQEEPSLPDIHPRRWEKVRRFGGLAFHTSFTAFVA